MKTSKCQYCHCENCYYIIIADTGFKTIPLDLFRQNEHKQLTQDSLAPTE